MKGTYTMKKSFIILTLIFTVTSSIMVAAPQTVHITNDFSTELIPPQIRKNEIVKTLLNSFSIKINDITAQYGKTISTPAENSIELSFELNQNSQEPGKVRVAGNLKWWLNILTWLTERAQKIGLYKNGKSASRLYFDCPLPQNKAHLSLSQDLLLPQIKQWIQDAPYWNIDLDGTKLTDN